MEFIRTSISDVIICTPTVHGDTRGYFIESFREDKLEEFLGYKINFCQVFANSANARENVASEGIELLVSQPQMRLVTGSQCRALSQIK